MWGHFQQHFGKTRSMYPNFWLTNVLYSCSISSYWLSDVFTCCHRRRKFPLAKTRKIFAHFFGKTFKPPTHEQKFGHRRNNNTQPTHSITQLFYSCSFRANAFSKFCTRFSVQQTKMTSPKWHQSTIQRVPYTELRSQRATKRTCLEDIVKNRNQLFLFPVLKFSKKIFWKQLRVESRFEILIHCY